MPETVKALADSSRINAFRINQCSRDKACFLIFVFCGYIVCITIFVWFVNDQSVADFSCQAWKDWEVVIFPDNEGF